MLAPLGATLDISQSFLLNKKPRRELWSKCATWFLCYESVRFTHTLLTVPSIVPHSSRHFHRLRTFCGIWLCQVFDTKISCTWCHYHHLITNCIVITLLTVLLLLIYKLLSRAIQLSFSLTRTGLPCSSSSSEPIGSQGPGLVQTTVPLLPAISKLIKVCLYTWTFPLTVNRLKLHWSSLTWVCENCPPHLTHSPGGAMSSSGAALGDH